MPKILYFEGIKAMWIKVQVALDVIRISENTSTYTEIVSIEPIVDDLIPMCILAKISDYLELGYKVVFFL